jgi:UDP-N-acetylmuramoyl-tripeptide--D-alanyl-D-alanine ligase
VVGYETRLYGEAHVTGVEEAVALLRTMGPGDAALFKGSRVTRLEDVVHAYAEAEGGPLLTSGAYRRYIENHIRAGNARLT